MRRSFGVFNGRDTVWWICVVVYLEPWGVECDVVYRYQERGLVCATTFASPPLIGRNDDRLALLLL